MIFGGGEKEMKTLRGGKSTRRRDWYNIGLDSGF